MRAREYEKIEEGQSRGWFSLDRRGCLCIDGWLTSTSYSGLSGHQAPAARVVKAFFPAPHGIVSKNFDLVAVRQSLSADLSGGSSVGLRRHRCGAQHGRHSTRPPRLCVHGRRG
jgi:hypothetical protein